MKPVRVVFSPEAAYQHLNAVAADSKIERSILNSIDKKKELIKANIHYGEPIAKDKIPNEYSTADRSHLSLTRCAAQEVFNIYNSLARLEDVEFMDMVLFKHS